MPIPEEALSRLETATRDVIAAHAADVDEQATFPTHTVDALRDAGLLGLITPTEHGGLGGSVADAAQVVERIAQACGTSAMVVTMHYAGAAVIAAHGSAEVNRAVAGGTHLSTLAFSEAGSRSHFWAPMSTATADGDHVVLDARKSWVTSATHATAYVWSSLPVAEGGASTLWLVPSDSDGLNVPGPYAGLGLRGNDSTRIAADGVRLPASHRLGPDGGAFDIMMGTVLPAFQLMSAACSLGLMEGSLNAAIAHVTATRHEQLGSRLCDLPTIRAYLAKARIRVDATRGLWLDTQNAMAEGRADTMLRVLEVKAASAEAALDVTATCMRVCGGAAYRREVGVERRFRDAQASSVMAPTTDVLYDFVGKAICGMDLF